MAFALEGRRVAFQAIMRRYNQRCFRIARSYLKQDADVMTEASQLGQLIEQCVDLLPQGFREVFMLRGVEQLSVRETSEITGIQAETVKTRYHRARKMMQENIQKQINTEELDALSFAGHRCQHITHAVVERLAKLELID